MNSKTKFNIGAIIGAGTLSVALAMISLDSIPWTQLAFWTGFCLIAEFFWVRSLDGKTVNSLAASARLATLFILGPLPALPVVFASTCLGNMIIRKSAWYKAAYNASQLTLSAAAAADAQLGAVAGGDQPDLLLISWDTVRADVLGPWGATGTDTPNFDRLVAEGVLFEDAVASTPITDCKSSTGSPDR